MHCICRCYINFEYVASVSSQDGKEKFPERWLFMLIVLHDLYPGKNIEGPVYCLFLSYLSTVYQLHKILLPVKVLNVASS